MVPSGVLTGPVEVVRRLDRARVVGGVAAYALVASYLLTWPLWEARSDPPNLLGVAGLRSLGFGWPLLLAALLAVGLPRVGSVAHAVLLVLAVAGDQIRVQPEFVCLAVVLVAAAWPARGLPVLRWYLVSLWLWAGLNKVLSGGWPTSGASFIAVSAGLPGWRGVVAVAVPAAEIGLGALACWPRAWRVLRIAGPAFHLGIVLLLARAATNSAVWPWNLALAVAVPLVFRAPEPAPRATRVVAAVLLLYPLGFYTGAVDAYLAHNLYSGNTVSGAVCRTHDGRDRCRYDVLSTWEALNVPLPPERRLLVDWFERSCRPGETLRVDGIWTRFAARAVTGVACPRGG
jgi:hypothetical protein